MERAKQDGKALSIATYMNLGQRRLNKYSYKKLNLVTRKNPASIASFRFVRCSERPGHDAKTPLIKHKIVTQNYD